MNAEALIGMVLGTCTLQKLIGQGGMGAVYLAQQSRPRRQVAVKVLLPVLPLAPNQRAAFLERFRRETDVVASLEHPNIMPVHEYGERDGLAYLVMPYVDGGTLRDELEREGQLPLEKVVFYLEQMAAALELAHESGVIHRDIKPANILLRREGRLLLADFGLVKIVTEGHNANARLTGVGMPVGTPDYMSPEQSMAGEVDARADLYSLGVILYQMVTGTVPFKGDMPMQVTMQHMHMSPPPPRSLRPDLPPAAEQVMLRALAKRPADRYMRVQDLAVAFRFALTSSGVPLPDFSTLLAPGVLTNAHLFTPQSLLEGAAGSAAQAGVPGITAQQVKGTMSRNDIIGKTSISMPSLAAFLPQNTPLPPTIATRPAQPSSTSSIPASPPRSGLGHKLNLRRPADGPGIQPLTPPPSVGAQGHMPQSESSVDAPPERANFRPSPIRSLGKSGLRPLTPLPPTGPASPPSMEGSGLRPLASFMSMNAHGQVPPTLLQRGNGQQPITGSGIGQFNPGFPTGNPSSTFSNPAVQPLNNWTSPQAGNSASYIPGGSTTQNLNNSTGQPLNSSMPSQAGNSASYIPGGSMTQNLNNSTGQLLNSSITQQLGASSTRQLTGALVMGKVQMSESGNTNMMKLSQAAKVIQVPVAGQPGRYVTGLLPVLEESKPALPPHIATRVEALNVRLNGRLKLFVLLAAVVLILFSSVAFWQVASHSRQTTTNKTLAIATTDVGATATVNVQATANANVIVSDALNGSSGNIHNWPIANNGPQLFAFKNGTYHVTANDPHPAIALLQDVSTPKSFVYTLTMQVIKNNEDSIDNRLGMIIRFNPGTKNGKKYATFYCFEVSNTNGGEYQFLKYDDSVDTTWTKLWPGTADTQHYGHEYHFGHSANSKNTFKVIANGNKFAFVVNGKQVGTAQDSSLTTGQVGMFVNERDTEVAFSNLLLTYK